MKVDFWTTQDGEWYPSDKPYSIDRKHVNDYPADKIPDAGAATHLVIHPPAGKSVAIVNRYNPEPPIIIPSKPEEKNGWVNFPMDKGSVYKPELGETGPWKVYVDSVLVAEGLGLPDSLHVSTFMWVEEDDRIETELGEGPKPIEVPPTETPPTQIEEDSIWLQILVNGKVYAGTLQRA